jgi:hypothetical protein
MSRLTVSLLLTAIVVLPGCLATKNGKPMGPAAVERVAAGLDRTRPTLNEEEVNAFGFQVYWDSYIRDEVIQSLSVEGDQIYAFTQSHRLYQVDMQSGMVNWVYDVGRPLEFYKGKRPITEYTYRAGPKGLKRYDEIFFVAGDYLYSLDKKNGSELWTTYLNFSPASAPQASKTHVFLGSWDDRVYAIRKEAPTVPDWSWRTGGDVQARPVVVGNQLFVGSEDGYLHTFESATGKIRQPFRTDRRLLTDAAAYLGLVYVPAEDFNLYVVGAADGLLHYRYGAGAPLNTRPVAIDKTIYFGAKGKGMFALARKGFPKRTEGNPRKAMHQPLWQCEGASQVLCKGVRDLYVRHTDKEGKRGIAKVNAKKGTVGASMEYSADFWLTNEFSPAALDRKDSLRGGIIYMGFRNGWIFSLKETATIPGA